MTPYASIPHALLHRAERRPDDTAFTFLGGGLAVERELTYAQLAEAAGRVAGFLRTTTRPGDRALLLFPPGADYLAAFLGCLSAGVVAVPLYPPRPGAKLDRVTAVVADCQAPVALTTAAMVPLLGELAAVTVHAVDDLDTTPAVVLPEPADLAFLQYTSGSTGDPKGVMVSHRNLTANMSAIAAGFGVRDDDVILSWLPMYHDMGLIGTTLLPLYAGRPAVLLNTFEFVRDPLSWLLALDRFGATCSGGPNFAYRLLTGKHDPARLSDVDLSRWRIAFNGAEPVRTATMAAFTERYAEHGFSGDAWFPCYGLAEATLFVSGATPMAGYRSATVGDGELVSSGAAAAETEIVIRSASGDALPDGAVGEICVRGPGVARGYWHTDSAETFEATITGHPGTFLRTGDLGALVGGELHVAGRVKDLIIVGGRNHHPTDVENAATAADDRSRAGAAFQVADRVVLVLEVAPRTDLDGLGDTVRRAVSAECELDLAEVVFVRPNSVPRTSSGKIRRAETRKRYTAGQLKVVGTAARKPAGELVAPLDTRTAHGLRALVADRIGFALDERDFTRPLAAVGMDSLKLVGLKGSIEQALGVRLSAELFFGDATLDDVIRAALLASPPAAAGAAPATPAATESQLQLQFFDQLHPDDRTNTLTCALRFQHRFTDAELRAAVTRTVARHAALRTSIDDGDQVVHDEPRFGWDSLELADDARNDFLAVVAYRPFDVTNGPLLRAAAVRTPTSTTLLLACHHAIADYASLRIVLADVLADLLGDASFALSTGPTTALDWTAEQALALSTPAAAEKLAALADRWHPHRDHLLFPGPQEVRRRNPAATVDFALDPARTEKLYRHSMDRGFTPFVPLAAAYLRALHRVTGHPTVTVGTLHHGRTDTRFADTVGYLVNPVPLLGDFTDGDDLAGLEDRTWRELRAALASADVPFPRLVRALSPERHGQNPLFQATITFQQSADGRLGDGFAIPWSRARDTVAGVAVEAVDVPPRDIAFAMSLYAARDGDRLVLRLVYQKELIDERTARRVTEEFRLAVDEAIGLRVAETVREEVAAPSLAWVTSLSDGFARAVELFGHRIAVRHNGTGVTYRQLDERVAELAGIIQAGATEGAPVGILLRRSVDMVVAALAVIRTGAAYVPVDPDTPAARVALILADAAPALVITTTDLADRVPAGVPVLRLDEPLPSAEPMPASACPATWDSRAYVIFTSGTTGRPKGVQVSHGNLLRLYTSTEDRYGFGPTDVWSAFHSFAFDVSVWEMWGALLHGGCLVVVPKDTAKDPAAFRSLLRAERVTVLSQTPTAFNQLVAEDVRHTDRLPLRWVVFGGEALHFSDLRRWVTKYGDDEPVLVNMYGITETTVHSSFRRVRRADLDQGSSLIGVPLSDLDFVLVDERLAPVAAGEIGEIVVTGPGVAMGYLNQPELTAERFITVAGATGPVRGYRSGDLAALTPAGEFAYHGRRDDQVKIRGFRIELSEIRAALGAVPGVLRAAVVVDGQERTGSPVVKDRTVSIRITDTRDLVRGAAPPPSTGPRIVAYVVGDDTLVAATLFERLRARLPEYMLPAFVVSVEEIPTNHNGKVDRTRLPAPTAVNCLRERVAARADAEETGEDVRLMCALFEEVLDTTGVRPDDSFFSVGGDSIIALRLRAAALTRGISIELGDLYTAQTPRALAAHVDTAPAETPIPVARFSMLADDDRAALPAGVVDAYPVGTLQAGLLFHSAYQTDVNMYCDIFMFRLRAPYDHDAMTAAVARVVERHEILRTSFDFTRFSQPLQLVHETGEAQLSLRDLRERTGEEQDAELTAWRAQEMSTPYDWARPPLVRFAVHLLSADEFHFAMGFHDSLLDGWSESNLVTEILTDYWALLGGTTPAVKEPPALRFADFIAAERGLLASAAAREFWQHELADVEPTLLPRLAAGAGDAHDGRMGFLSVDVPAELSARLDEVAAQNRVSLKHVLLAVHARVLALLTGRPEVVLGVESNGRVEGAGGADVLGVHLNVVPYRMSTADLTWTKLVEQTLVKETALLGVRGYPYAEVQRLAGVRDLTDVSFNYTHFHAYQRLASATDIAVLDAKAYLQTNFTLRTEFNKDPFSKLLTLDLEANMERVSEPQLRQIAEAYRNALEHLAAEPERVPAARDLLGERRWAALLADAAGPVREHQESGFLSLFARTAGEHTDRVAAVCGHTSLTYGELAGRVGAFAGWLHAYGVGKDTVVGLRAGRDLDHLVAVLAIMRVGAVYLPLPAGPPARVASMVRRGAAKLVLHDTASGDLVTAAVGTVATVDLADATAAARNHTPYEGPFPRDADRAYIIFTSGSTGEPKGALIRHDGMLNHVLAKVEVLGLTSADRVSQDAAATFDISLWQWFSPLAVGATTVIYPDEIGQDPPTLLRAVADDVITVLEVSPSVLSVFCAELDDYSADTYPPFALRWVASSGETLKPKAANEFRRLLPTVRLVNMWGITETSDDCTHYELTGPADERAPSVPVGGPIANSAVYVLDANREPVPTGTPGELYVGGVCVGAGYVNDEERTALAFVSDPFVPGEVLYRTGDRGRRLADGGFEFLGRLDSQLKIRGQRIELGEVERALGGVDGVRESAVVVRVGDDGEKRLAGFFVAATELSPADLRTALGTVLPRYGVPDFLVPLAELPRTPHGKVDTKALRALDVTGPAAEERTEAPATPTEAAILEVIATVLKVPSADPTADFFELGGHSLHATQVMARLRNRFGVDLPLRLLFDHRDARGLARCVDEAVRNAGSYALEKIPRRPAGTTRFPLAMNQASLWFLHQVDPDDRAYENTSLLGISGPLDLSALRAAVDTLARRHEVLTMRFGSDAGVPYQEPDPRTRVALEIIAADFDPAEVVTYVRAFRERYDLARGPLVRARLWRFSDTEHVFEWSCHHIVSDGWSSGVAMRDIRAAYLAHQSGHAPDLPDLTAQYADYARWQEKYLATHARPAELFWQSYLDGYEGELALATDHPRTEDRSRAAGYATRTWDSAATERLRAFAARRKVTPFLLGHAATAVLMAKFAQQSDIVLGAVVAGRTVPGTENLIGFFADTVPLRYFVDLGDTPADLLAAVAASALRALENQRLPFGRIVESSGVGRTPGVAPLVQVLVTFDNFPLDLSGLPGLSTTLTQVPPVTSQFDLLLRFDETDELALTVQYDTTLLTATTVARLLDAMAAVLDFFVTHPDEPLSSAELARAEDTAALAALWRELTGEPFDLASVLASPRCAEFLDLAEEHCLLTALLLAL